MFNQQPKRRTSTSDRRRQHFGRNIGEGAKKKTGKTTQELTDEKRKELDEKVKNGGTRTSRSGLIRSYRKAYQLSSREAVSAYEGARGFILRVIN